MDRAGSNQVGQAFSSLNIGLHLEHAGADDTIPKSVFSTQDSMLFSTVFFLALKSCTEQTENWPLPRGTKCALFYPTSCFKCWLYLGRSMQSQLEIAKHGVKMR